MRLCLERGELFVVLERGFGPADARRIEELAAAGGVARVTVDFSRALDFQYGSLEAMARAFGQLGQARVRFRGLSLRQTCLLQECVDRAEGRARA